MSNKETILILVTNDIRQDQRMQRIAQSLSEIDYKVTILGRKTDNKPIIEIENINTSLLSIPFRKGVLFYLFYMLQSLLFLFRNRPSIVYAVDPDTLISSTIYSKLFGRKMIYDSHEYFSEVPELISSPSKKKIWTSIEKWGVKQASLLITVGDELAELFSKTNNKTFYPILNINPKPIQSNQNNNYEKKTLLYQGMLNKGRGIEAILEAMDRLPDWELQIIGKGDLELKLKEQAASSESCDRVKFLGFINPQNLNQYTEQATIGINLLDKVSMSYYYSLANKTFDYMNAGIPALHMDFPEYANIQKAFNCFVLIKQLNALEIANKISQIDSVFYQKLVSNNQIAAENFTWEKESAKLKKLVKSIET